MASVGATFHTSYRNLVVVGAGREFCLVSGVHERGFPWGDPHAVSDVLLAVFASDGAVRRFVMAGDTLAGLTHDVVSGRFEYRGKLCELPAGHWRVGQSELLALPAVDAELVLDLEVVPMHAGALKLPRAQWVEDIKAGLGKQGNSALGDEHARLGMAIDPGAVRVKSGKLLVRAAAPVELDAAGARGESEHGDYVALKAPAIGYHYLCTIHPEADAARDGAIEVLTDVLDPGGGGLGEDTVAGVVGSLLRKTAGVAQSWKDGVASAQPLAGQLDSAVVEPVLKLVWDGLETGYFERKIVWAERAGVRALALEEAMFMKSSYGAASRTQAIEAVHVVKNPDKLAALDAVLAATGFDAVVQGRARELGVDLAALRVVIKPNFMFMYSLNDPSTYTDPELVLHLVDRLRALGCRDVKIIEAQSAYGNYFEGREVRNVAEYIGYQLDDPRYQVVDLTTEMVPFDYGHRLGHHFVGPTWRDAQLRLSFAKNKTHTWAYYTLSLKNTYGCLPMQNKLREYHHDREIYYPTTDALRHFPLHFCLIDASLSADGQFGIFADTHPNKTETIIGGRDPIAVDWVAASKMGLNPMLSRYMREAVAAFGRPEVVHLGDRTRYPGWRNVAVAMTEFWDRAEEHYGFSDLLFRVLNEMDARFKRKKEPWHVRLLRWLTGWFRKLVFKRPRALAPPGVPPTRKALGPRSTT